MRGAAWIPALLLGSSMAAAAAPQPNAVPTLRVGSLPAAVHLDGVLDEPAWAAAPAIETLTMSEPNAGAMPRARTVIRVLADARAIVIGVECDDPDPARIVSYTKQRDAVLDTEDHVTIVFDTFLDGRSGYVFAVNPSGARYDALINPGGADANPDWDGIWDAATHRDEHGWSVEIWIPVQTLGFKRGLTEWHFNVERRIQRLQETDRWSSARPDWTVTQTSRAGLLTGLPDFSLGLGLTLRPAGIAGGGIPAAGAAVENNSHGSLDVLQRLGPNVNASVSVNTDFAETEVDTRQTNLTRFPLFFPEKRTFFLEGSDVFTFGLGLSQRLVPFFSRTIGLLEGQEVPINVAGKVNGRVGDTNFGAVFADTRAVDGLTTGPGLGAVRVKRNVLGESSVGFIGTVGDPAGAPDSWLGGADVTLQTSHFHSDRNLRVGFSGEVMNRAGLTGDKTATSARIEYPNDLWSLWFGVTRIGDAFQPSLGFVPRAGVYAYDTGIDYSPRPHNGWLRQAFPQFEPTLVTDLHGRWESYEVFTAPINWRFESGDRVEFNIVPEGERIGTPFPLDGVVIPPGSYQWLRYRLEAGSALKRRFSAQATWRFGGFYSGSLDQFLLVGSWHPSGLLSIDFNGERDLGKLAEGRFRATLVGIKANLNLSPHLQASNFIQYDTTSASVGTNSRLRWTLTPVAELFVIYNHNIREMDQSWRFDSNQFLVKFQYAFRY
jgi:hypothetical protein